MPAPEPDTGPSDRVEGGGREGGRGPDRPSGLRGIDRAPVTMTGTAPAGAQLKFASLPEDPWLRPGYERGAQAYRITTGWTTRARADGTFSVDGVIPGEYAVVVSARYVTHNGVTGVGVYVNGGLEVSVPLVIGFWVSPASPSVVSATDPANDWLRLTLKLPTLAVVAVAGSVTDAGAFIWKSGICIVRPE